MRFAIYSRKSVLTGRGESIENQVELCRSYLAAHYPGVRPEEVAVYEDEGFSGKDFQRPQFRRMLEDIRRARPEALVCYRLDRVSRSVGDFADLIRRLEGWGVAFLCIRERFDTSTPMGKAMMYIASVFAQLERETIAQRVRDNMCLLARTGRWLGGTTPTGFRAERTAEVIVDGRARTACRLVPDPAEWGRAAAIFRLFLARQSLSGLSRALAEEGITARTGRPFSLPGLRELLQNPVYCAADGDAWDYFAALGADLCFPRADCDGRRGLLAYQKRDYSGGRAPRNPVDRWIIALGRHPALVSGATWRAVQELLTPDRAPAVHNRRAAVRPAVLRPVRGEAASQGPKGRFLRLHLPGQAAPGRGGLFLPQPVRRGGRSGGAGRPLRPVSPPGPPAGGAGPGGAARRVPHPPPAGRLGRGGPGLHPLPPLSVCPSPGGPFPTLIAIITMFFVGTSGGPGRGLLAALLLTGVILLGVFLTFGVSRLLSGTLLRGVPSSFTLELPPYRRPRIGQVVVRSVLDRTLFVLGRAAAVAAPAGLLIWLCANVQVGGDSILNWCTGFLDPFARLLGLDGVILMAFLLGFPANEIVIPIIIMAYLSTGSLLEFDSLDALRQLLVDHGWTWLTAVCTMLFSLMHWPCSTTCLTIGKETKSAKWTLLSIAIPTGIGMAVCFLVASAARLLGLA